MKQKKKSLWMEILLFDIIVPLYNVKQEWVERCLDSILSQSFKNYEVWICDGTPEANDSNKELRKTISQKYPDFNYVRQTGIGVGQARNQAIRLGVNPFVAFLDGDDYWYPNWLEQAHTYITNNMLDDEATIIGEAEGTIQMISKMKGNVWDVNITYHTFNPAEWKSEYHYYYIPKTPLFPSFTIMRRSRIEDVDGFREDIGVMEDIIFCSQVCGDKLNKEETYRVVKIEGLFGWKESHENNSAYGGNQSGLTHENYSEHFNLCSKIAEKYYHRTVENKPNDVDIEWWNYYSEFEQERIIKLI